MWNRHRIMVSTYYKISLKSQGNNSLNSFFFLYVNKLRCLKLKYTSSKERSRRQRRWKLFGRALGLMLISNEKQKEITRLSDDLSRKILGFLSGYFSPRTPWRNLSGKVRSQELRQKMLYERVWASFDKFNAQLNLVRGLWLLNPSFVPQTSQLRIY